MTEPSHGGGGPHGSARGVKRKAPMPLSEAGADDCICTGRGSVRGRRSEYLTIRSFAAPKLRAAKHNGIQFSFECVPLAYGFVEFFVRDADNLRDVTIFQVVLHDKRGIVLQNTEKCDSDGGVASISGHHDA